MEKKIVYVSLDARRALWIHESTGAVILCSYYSDLIPLMRASGVDVWCLQEQCPDQAPPEGSAELLSHAKTLNYLKSLKADLEFIVFKPSNKILSFLAKQSWTLRSAQVKLCRRIEDKIEFFSLAQKCQLPIPRSIILSWGKDSAERCRQEFGSAYILQKRVGHAGTSTILVRAGETPQIEEGTAIKASELVDGPTYTMNLHLSRDGKLRSGPLWQQLSRVPEWNRCEMGTVGVTPAAVAETAFAQMEVLLDQLKQLLVEVGFWGFFGIDAIWNGQRWYLIEVNPRLTASISLQCLEDLVQERPALLLEPREDGLDLRPGAYSQLIFRNTKGRPWKLPKTLKSGIYSRVSGKWRLTKRSFDARELQAGEVLLLLAWSSGSTIEVDSDYASLQTKGSVLDEGGEISDHIHDFYERVIQGQLIRANDFWQGTFLKIEKGQPFLLRKPLGVAKTKEQLRDLELRYRQTQLLEGEVLKLLGEYEGYFLAERADGSRGWLVKEFGTMSNGPVAIPGKACKTAEEFFQHWLGSPYLYGGNSEEGIDCSAFVQRYFWEVKGILLPRNTQDQKTCCTMEVCEAELQNDDLVFLHSKDKEISHVGVWRQGHVIHASLENGVQEQRLEQLLEKYELEEFLRR
ncbi:MAG: NlpC/P60 family protein [bacterium]|nr:NlpC/P60 family protein [bacterium]